MADDWQVGDLAVCVRDGSRFKEAGIRVGGSYRVIRVVMGRSKDFGLTVGLVLAGITMPPGKKGAVARHFRKIRPDEHEACEPEFVTLLKRAKRPVSA